MPCLHNDKIPKERICGGVRHKFGSTGSSQRRKCSDCSSNVSVSRLQLNGVLKKKKENVLLSRHVTRDTYNCVMVIRDTDWADVLLSAAKPPTKDQEPLLNLMHLIEQNKGKGKETCSHIGAALSNTPGAQ